MLNARINEIPSLVHSTNNCVVISQLYDAAYFKDGIFRRFYFYFMDSSSDAQKFCNLYNRESSMLRTIRELKDSVKQSTMAFKEAPVCRSKEERIGFNLSNDQNEVSSCGSIICCLEMMIN